jgi:hypothetical protein
MSVRDGHANERLDLRRAIMLPARIAMPVPSVDLAQLLRACGGTCTACFARLMDLTS